MVKVACMADVIDTDLHKIDPRNLPNSSVPFKLLLVVYANHVSKMKFWLMEKITKYHGCREVWIELV